MGTARDQTPLHMVVKPDERWIVDNITPKEHATALLQSAYTQRSPKAGTADPGGAGYDMGLRAHSGTDLVPQDAELTIETARAGHPVPRGYGGGGGGGFVYKNVLEEAAPTYRGWDHYSAITDILPVVATTNAVNESNCNVIRIDNYAPKRGHLMTVCEKDANDPRCFRYDPDVGSWINVNNIGLTVSTAVQFALVELPDGRIILFHTDTTKIKVDAYYTDDGGDTWGIYAADVLGTPITDSAGAVVTPNRLQVAYSNGEILLLVSYLDSGHSWDPNLAQYSSIDKGATFTLIKGDFWLDDGIYPSSVPTVAAGRDSGFVVTCYNYDELASVSTAAVYRLGTSVTPLDDATPLYISDYGSGVVWDNPSVRALTHFFDEDWNLYIVELRYDASPGKYKLHVHRSIDYGATSEAHQMDSWDSVDNLEYVYKFDCAATGGKAFLVSRYETDSTTSYDGPSVISVCLGAMSAHTLPVSDLLTAASGENPDVESNQLAWAPDPGETGEAISYIPTSFPIEQSWTTSGAGSESLSSDNDLSVVPAGGLREYTRAFVGTSVSSFAGHWIVKIPSGGDKTASDISINIIHRTAGGYECEVEIRLEDNGYIVRDMIAPANLVTVTADLTDFHHIRVAIEDDNDVFKISVWSCEAGHRHAFARRLDEQSLTTRIATTPTRVKWGARAATVDNSNWRFSAFSTMPGHWTDRATTYISGWDTPQCLHPRTYSTVPMLVDDGIYISATSGPTRIGETWDVKADYEYPLWAMDPSRSRHPSRKWRSVDTSAAVDLVFDSEPQYSDGYMDNSVLAFFFLGANFEVFEVEGWNGAAWEAIATATASTGFQTLAFTRGGRKVRPNFAATNVGERYLNHEDHVGDTWNFDNAAGTQHVKIVHNTEGAWRVAAASPPPTKTPTLELDNDQLVGTEPAAGAGGEIWRRDFGVIISGYNGTYDRFRIKIPIQSTADGYFEAGQYVAGAGTLLARQYDHGYIYTHLYPVDIRELPDGSSTDRSLGSCLRRFTFGWDNTVVDTSDVNAASPDPDYRRMETGLGYPAGTMHDTTRVMEGILRRTVGSAGPVLLLTAVDQNTSPVAAYKVQQESRQRCMLWGKIVTEPRVTAIRGDEGASELEQMAALTIEELV